MTGFMRRTGRRAEKRSLTQKILASLTAFGVVAGPWFTQLAAANAIEKADAGKAGTITTNGAVTNVLADSVRGDNAINTFKHFSLDQGNIANLYFGTTTAGGAKNLINFVGEAISINGTVNAVRANKIGGNCHTLKDFTIDRRLRTDTHRCHKEREEETPFQNARKSAANALVGQWQDDCKQNAERHGELNALLQCRYQLLKKCL